MVSDKKAMTFRLGGDARKALAELSSQSGLSATAVIEGLLLNHDAPWHLGVKKAVNRKYDTPPVPRVKASPKREAPPDPSIMPFAKDKWKKS